MSNALYNTICFKCKKIIRNGIEGKKFHNIRGNDYCDICVNPNKYYGPQIFGKIFKNNDSQPKNSIEPTALITPTLTTPISRVRSESNVSDSADSHKFFIMTLKKKISN